MSIDGRNLSENHRHRLLMKIASLREECGKLIDWMDREKWTQNEPTYQTLIAARHSLHAAVNAVALSVKLPIEPPRTWIGPDDLERRHPNPSIEPHPNENGPG